MKGVYVALLWINMEDDKVYEVVWSGRMPLLPDREERADSRLSMAPTFEDEPVTPRKKSDRLYAMKNRGPKGGPK